MTPRVQANRIIVPGESSRPPASLSIVGHLGITYAHQAYRVRGIGPRPATHREEDMGANHFGPVPSRTKADASFRQQGVLPRLSLTCFSTACEAFDKTALTVRVSNSHATVGDKSGACVAALTANGSRGSCVMLGRLRWQDPSAHSPRRVSHSHGHPTSNHGMCMPAVCFDATSSAFGSAWSYEVR